MVQNKVVVEAGLTANDGAVEFMEMVIFFKSTVWFKGLESDQMCVKAMQRPFLQGSTRCHTHTTMDLSQVYPTWKILPIVTTGGLCTSVSG